MSGPRNCSCMYPMFWAFDAYRMCLNEYLSKSPVQSSPSPKSFPIVVAAAASSADWTAMDVTFGRMGRDDYSIIFFIKFRRIDDSMLDVEEMFQ